MAESIKIGEAYVEVKLLADAFNKALEQAEGQFNSFSKKLDAIGSKMSSIGKSMSLTVTTPLTGIGLAAIKSSADIEMLTASFTTMLGSADKAAKMVESIKKMAALTPFGTQDLAQATQTLLGFGVAENEVLGVLNMLGDSAQGNAEKLKGLALVFGQVRAQGKLMGQDTFQFINQGVPIMDALAKSTGKTQAQLMKMREEGQITSQMVEDAFIKMTSAGGQFYKGMDTASKTLSGLLSTLRDEFMELLRSAIEPFVPAIKEFVKDATELAKSFTTLSDETKKQIVIFLAVAAAAGPVLTVIGNMVTSVVALGKAFGSLLIFAANPFVIAIAGFAAVAAGIALLIKRNQDLKKEEEERTLAAIKKQQEEEKLIVARNAAYDQLNDKQKKAIENYEKELTAISMIKNKVSDPEEAKMLGKVEDVTAEWGKINDQVSASNEKLAKYNKMQEASLRDVGQVNELVKGQQEEEQKKNAELLKAQSHLKGVLSQYVQVENVIRAAAGQQSLIINGINDEVTAKKASAKAEVELTGEAKSRWNAYLAFLKEYQDKAKLVGKTPLEVTAMKEAEALTKLQLYYKNNYFGYLGTQQQIKEATAKYEAEKAKIVKVYADERTKIEREQSNAVAGYITSNLSNIGSQLSGILNTYYNNQATQAEYNKQKQIETSNAEYEAKKANIEKTVVDVDERNKQLEALDRDRTQKEKAIEEQTAKEKRRIAYEQAIATKALGIFQATVSTAQAIIAAIQWGMTFGGALGPVLGGVQAGIAGALGAAQIASIAATPLPPLAKGGYFSGPALIGEAGREFAFPLDGSQGQAAMSYMADNLVSAMDRSSARASMSPAGTGESMFHVIVNVAGEKFYDAITSASRDGRILIDARAVV